MALGALAVGLFAFFASWVPALGIVLGNFFGWVAVLAGVLSMFLSRPRSRWAGIVGIALGLVTVFLKGVPILRWF